MALISTLSKEAQKIMVSFVNNKDREKTLKLMFNWPEVVGELIALNSSPKKLKNNPGKGIVLTIEVANSAIGTEIYYMKREILARVNAFLGTDQVVDLFMSQNYRAIISKEAFSTNDSKVVTLGDEEKKICDVGDHSMSESLVGLLKAIKSK